MGADDEAGEEINQEDVWEVISAYFDEKGLVRQQLDRTPAAGRWTEYGN